MVYFSRKSLAKDETCERFQSLNPQCLVYIIISLGYIKEGTLFFLFRRNISIESKNFVETM